MSADLPHTLYNTKGKEKGPTQDDVDEATKAYLEAKERRAKEKADNYTIEEVFSGAADMIENEKSDRICQKQ